MSDEIIKQCRPPAGISFLVSFIILHPSHIACTVESEILQKKINNIEAETHKLGGWKWWNNSRIRWSGLRLMMSNISHLLQQVPNSPLWYEYFSAAGATVGNIFIPSALLCAGCYVKMATIVMNGIYICCSWSSYRVVHATAICSYMHLSICAVNYLYSRFILLGIPNRIEMSEVMVQKIQF